jgi:hypothetical protein
MRNARIALFAALVVWLIGTDAFGQTRRASPRATRAAAAVAPSRGQVTQARFDNNPITRWAAAQDGESVMRQAPAAPLQATPQPLAPPMQMGSEYVPYAEPIEPLHSDLVSGGDCQECGPAGPCDQCAGPCSPRRRSIWDAGFALMFVQPRFSDNLALSVSENEASSAAVTDTSFDYELEFAPRVWLEWAPESSVGWRVQWWQFDQDADQVLVDAPGNGLGRVAPPEFRDIDISVSAPGETLRADNHLRMYAIDFEATRRVNFDCWSLFAAGGLRHASFDYDYRAVATNANGVQSGTIEQNRSVDGIGPTFLVEARRPVSPRLTVFSNARASLLFGDGETTLAAGEDLDVASSFTTTRSSENDDLLPILEGQLGLSWCTAITPCHEFTCSAALEGQWWGGVGTASSDTGDLGLLGFVVGLGLQY